MHPRLFFLLCGILLLSTVFLLVDNSIAADRCESLRQIVRVEHTRYFGENFPYWYGIGQLKQESCCRSNATAFDSGQGVAQFMPKTVQYVNSLMHTNLNPYNVKDAVRMQAFYMAKLHKENWTGELWLTYQGYNGGFTLLKKEAKVAGCTNWDKMKKVCKRNIIHFKWGDLNLCDVNYNYSKNIYNYGNTFRIGEDTVPFW